MKVFVTGGTGYLGGHVVRALLAAGHKVLALVRDRERAAALVGCGASILEGDITETESWLQKMGECEAVVHTAAAVLPWTSDPEVFERVNVRGTLDLVDRAHEAGIPRVLVTSSFFVFGPSAVGTVSDEGLVGNPLPPLTRVDAYVYSKRKAAELLWQRQRSGYGITLLYPTILLGPGALTFGNHTAQVIADIGRRRFPGLVGDGEQIWNLVSVEGAARGFALALDRGRPGENYILGGENWTQKKLVERAAVHFKVKPPLRRLGRSLPLTLAWLAEQWSSLTGRTPFLTRGSVRLYDAEWAFTSEKAQRALGYETGDVEATVAATVAWLRDEVWKRRG